MLEVIRNSPGSGSRYPQEIRGRSIRIIDRCYGFIYGDFHVTSGDGRVYYAEETDS